MTTRSFESNERKEMKDLCYAVFMLVSFSAAGQNSWGSLRAGEKMKILKESVDSLIASKNHELKAEMLMAIVGNYITSERNDSIVKRMEKIFIGISLFSNQYFYNLYETEFKQFYDLNIRRIKVDKLMRERMSRVILAQAVRKTEIDRNFFREAFKLTDESEFGTFDCRRIAVERSSPAYFEELSVASDSFFQALIFCSSNEEQILDLRLCILFSARRNK